MRLITLQITNNAVNLTVNSWKSIPIQRNKNFHIQNNECHITCRVTHFLSVTQNIEGRWLEMKVNRLGSINNHTRFLPVIHGRGGNGIFIAELHTELARPWAEWLLVPLLLFEPKLSQFTGAIIVRVQNNLLRVICNEQK